MTEDEHDSMSLLSANRNARFNQLTADPLPLALGQDGHRREGEGRDGRNAGPASSIAIDLVVLRESC
jgi:hypothetical protein